MKKAKDTLLRSLLPKLPDGTCQTVYILVMLSFFVRFLTADNGVSAAGCLAVAVAMAFALSVYHSKKKAERPPKTPHPNEETE